MLEENEELDFFQYATYHIGMRIMLSQLTNEMLEEINDISKTILEERKEIKNASKVNNKSK